MSATFGNLEDMLFNRTTEGQAGLVEPEQLADEATDGTLTVATAGDAETPVDALESTQEPWEEFGFSSAEELANAYRNVNTLRGKLANEVGELRRQIREEGAATGTASPEELAVLLSEERARILATLERFAQVLAASVDERVGTVERKVARLIERVAQESGFNA